ncbi:hypothetical protein BDZ89DRAFT_1056214 [Hymenopellis radicata]|nr:hypothetical protein BDZ89DRAFT_1056214 [Hymenopellis radicata]
MFTSLSIPVDCILLLLLFCRVPASKSSESCDGVRFVGIADCSNPRSPPPIGAAEDAPIRIYKRINTIAGVNPTPIFFPFPPFNFRLLSKSS